MMELMRWGRAAGLGHFESRFNGVDVGGVQCQRDVRNHFLNHLDHPGHELMPVLLGRPQVDVDVVHPLFLLKEGLFLDRFRVPFPEGLADLFGYHIQTFPNEQHTSSFFSRTGLSGPEHGRKVGRFPGADDNLPAGKFFFHVACDGGGISGNDDFLMLHLVSNAGLLNKSPHIIPGELPGSPGGEDAKALPNP